MRDKAGEPSERRSTSSSITLALERQCETPPRLSRLLAPSLQSSQSQLSFRMMLFEQLAVFRRYSQGSELRRL